MRHIVLIHGAWHAGWCWDGLALRLRAAGWRVDCPDLPDDPGTGIAECLAALPDAPVILGHSMGGILAEAVAQRCAPRLLIHLCSYAPLPGDSLARLDRLLPGPARDWPRDAQGRLVMPPERAAGMLYPDAPPAEATRAAARLRAQPVGPMVQPLPGPGRAEVARRYLLCTRDRAIAPSLQRAMARRAGIAHVQAMDWDHSPFLSDPEGLAQVLLRMLPAQG